MCEDKPQRIPKHPGAKSDIMKYAKQGITLLAAQLANDETIEDYWLITGPESVDYFGHIIAVIIDSKQNRYALFVETKLLSMKSMRFITNPETPRDAQKSDVPLHKYLQTYEKIMRMDLTPQLKTQLAGIPTENFYFCLFTIMPRNIVIQTKNKEMMDVKLELKNINENILNCFGAYAQCCQNADTLPEGYEKFLKQFYIFAEQPSTQKVYQEFQEHIGKSSDGAIDRLCDSIESVMKEDKFCLPLTKLTFFEKCLEIQLSDVILF
ncbi:uncharacterized protein [Onthophagus taurus]|uniref:uncharacterized protein n=1 Tax=Onthophagus taurus TaxID=166361 RepID=UPI0039BE9B10